MSLIWQGSKGFSFFCAEIREEETTRKDPFMEVTAGRGKTENLIGLTLTAVRVGGSLYFKRAKCGSLNGSHSNYLIGPTLGLGNLLY